MGFKHSWCLSVMKMKSDQIRHCLHNINIESVTISPHVSDPQSKHLVDASEQK